jgi:mannosyltransferase
LRIRYREGCGVAAGLVTAFLPVTSHYGMEARPYAITCALVTWTHLLLIRASRPSGALGWWIGYAAALAAASTMFLYALLIGLAHTLTLAWSHRPKRFQLASLAAASVVVAPVAVRAADQSGQVAWISRVLAKNIFSAPLAWVISVPEPKPSSWSGPSVVFLQAAAVALGLTLWILAGKAVTTLSSGRRADGIDLFALAIPATVLPMSILVFASVFRPMFVERYVFFSTPTFALLIGYALSRLAARRLIGCVALMVALALPLWLADRQPLSKMRSLSSGRMASTSLELSGVDHLPDVAHVGRLAGPARRGLGSAAARAGGA